MPRKSRHLNAEDRALWEKVTAAAKPMWPERPKPTTRLRATKGAQGQPVITPAPEPVPRFQIGQAVPSAQTTRIDLASDAAQRLAAMPVQMDNRTFRRLTRGRLRPEGRIDLHGMTLAQAHPALVAFVLSSQSAGRRLVLVITGKGRGGSDGEGPIPQRRGVLRDQVPRWLTTGHCAAAVIQVVQAHTTHGGSGAYYVYLRRKR